MGQPFGARGGWIIPGWVAFSLLFASVVLVVLLVLLAVLVSVVVVLRLSHIMPAMKIRSCLGWA